MMSNVSATGSTESADSTDSAASGHAPGTQTAPQSSSHNVPTGLQALVSNHVYGMRKERFKAALNSNSVGRELAQNPYIVNSRLTNDPSEPPIYQGGGEDKYEGVINLRDANSFPSRAEHDATFTHEALHKLHHMESPELYGQRKQTNGTHPGWSNAEEEYTITGEDPSALRSPPTRLSENTARTELNLNERNSHFAVRDDLPSRMTAAEYRVHRQRENDEAGASLQMETTAPSRPMPARLRQRLEAQQKRTGKG